MQRAQRLCGGFLLPQDGAVNLLTGTSSLREPLAVFGAACFVGVNLRELDSKGTMALLEANLKMDGAAR